LESHNDALARHTTYDLARFIGLDDGSKRQEYRIR